MEISVIQAIFVFIVASIIGIASVLDEGQFHRPLIACTLMGLALGNITEGIIIGATLELLALGWNNIGAAVAPDAAIASVVTVLLVLVSKIDRSTAIGLAIPLATAGQVLSIFLRTFVVGLQHGADRAAVDGNFKWVEIYHYVSIILYSLRVSLPAIAIYLTASASVVSDFLQGLPEVLVRGLSIAGGFIVVVGYAMIINMMRASHLMPFFFIGFVIAAFTNINLVGMGVIGLCLALIYVNVHPKYNLQKGVVTNNRPNKLDNQLD